MFSSSLDTASIGLLSDDHDTINQSTARSIPPAYVPPSQALNQVSYDTNARPTQPLYHQPSQPIGRDTRQVVNQPSSQPTDIYQLNRPNQTNNRRPVVHARPTRQLPGLTFNEPLMAPDPSVNQSLHQPDINQSRSQAVYQSIIRYLTGSWSVFWYYLSHAKLEMSKRKFNFCLGVSSCFLTVLVSATCYTLIARAPVVFLQQAEADYGQYDARLSLGSGVDGKYINYTAVTLNLNSPDLSYHTPRLVYTVNMYDNSCTNRTRALGLNPLTPQWKYVGYPGSGCNNQTLDCLSRICTQSGRREVISLYVLDTLKEKRMELGRLWTHDAIPAGAAIIPTALALSKQLSIGDIFYLTISLSSSTTGTPGSLPFAFTSEGSINVHGSNFFSADVDARVRSMLYNYGSVVSLAVKVHAIVDDWRGKIANDIDSTIIMEYNNFLPFFGQSMHPQFDSKTIDSSTTLPMSPREYFFKSSMDMYSYASNVPLSLPPSRIEPYMATNYDDIQARVVNWAATVMYYASFPQFDLALPILDSLYSLRFVSLFLGLILSVILTILFILSTMLIYSLLMISIETRTFELGVHRMVGMTTPGVIKMLLVQACSYSIPAWVFGLIISQVLAALISAKIESEIEVPVARELTGYSIFVASMLGLLIPLLAAVLPIRTALSKNLHDSLDTSHSKTVGVAFSIERSSDKGFSSAWMACGTGLLVFGFLIYYLLPLSLLSLNLTLFFNLFFGLLLALLFGLILLSLNLQHMLEKFLLKVFFWWERPQIPFIVSKNLVAHRQRNRKTSIMFALSLGFIIFITVAYDVQIQSARYRALQQNGQVITMGGRNSYLFDNSAVTGLEAAFLKNDLIDSWAWVTNRLGSRANEWSSTRITNLGHAYSLSVSIYGVTSNFYDVALPDFIDVAMGDQSTGMSLSEQLYTVRGEQSVILGSSAKTFFNLNGLDGDSSFLFELSSGSNIQYQRMKPLAFMNLSPRFSFTAFPGQTSTNAVVSLPTYLEMTGGLYRSPDALAFGVVIIKPKKGITDSEMDRLVAALKSLGNSEFNAYVYDSRVLGDTLAQSDAVMSLIFESATYIAMGLCLFSLMASMFTNIYEQSKEIAIIRAIGLPASAIVRIYLYEAFVLVLGASLLGMLIGALMSFTMNAQQTLFTQLPVDVPFPYQLIVLVIIGSFLCAIVASCLPARALVKRKIATIMRTVL